VFVADRPKKDRRKDVEVGDRMGDADRLTRLEDALTDLAIIVTEGNWDRLRAHMAPDVVEAGKRLQRFHRAVANEREI
jgi:hypothetical protein